MTHPTPVSLRHRVGLWLGPIWLLATLALDPPGGLTLPAWRVAGLALLMATWWISEALPIPVTALLPLVLLPLLGVGGIGNASAPYADPVIFLFLGGFLLAAGLERSGLHRRLALAILGRAGESPAGLVAGFMAATGFLSMWVSNTATVVMMLPMATTVIALTQDRLDDVGRHFPVALLLGLAYAANIGGLGTLIGTPPNALLAGFMAKSYGVEIGFGQWMLVGLPLVLVALPLTWWLLTRALFPLRGAVMRGGADWLTAERSRLGPPSRAEWLVGMVACATAGLWIARPLLERLLPGLSDPGIALAGALALFLIPARVPGGEAVLTWRAAERIPWGVLVLFGGGLSLAAAIQTSGLATWLGDALMGLGAWPLVLVVAAVTTLVVFLTELTSNTATAAAFLPIAGALAVGIGVPPLMLALPTALAASCAFMLPVATPPNAIVYASERLTVPQMARAGLWLNLVMIGLLLAVTFGLAGPLWRG